LYENTILENNLARRAINPRMKESRAELILNSPKVYNSKKEAEI
jgi:hypothetical protein